MLTRRTTRVLPLLTSLASASQSAWRPDPCLALVTTVRLSCAALLLAKPQTYVNLSGRSVSLLLSE